MTARRQRRSWPSDSTSLVRSYRAATPSNIAATSRGLLVEAGPVHPAHPPSRRHRATPGGGPAQATYAWPRDLRAAAAQRCPQCRGAARRADRRDRRPRAARRPPARTPRRAELGPPRRGPGRLGPGRLLRAPPGAGRFAEAQRVVARHRRDRRGARRGRPARHRAGGLRLVLLRRRPRRAAARSSCPRSSSVIAATAGGSPRSAPAASPAPPCRPRPELVAGSSAREPGRRAVRRRRDLAGRVGERRSRCGATDLGRRAGQGGAGPRPRGPGRRRRSTRAGSSRGWSSGYAGTWVYAVDGLVGATPELLCRLERGLVTSRVLAGTIRRTGDDAHDLALAGSLARSSKDLEEHEYAAASVAGFPCAALLFAQPARVAVRPAPAQRDAPGHRHRRRRRRRLVVARAGRRAAPLGRGLRHPDRRRARGDPRARGHGPRPLRRTGRLAGRHPATASGESRCGAPRSTRTTRPGSGCSRAAASSPARGPEAELAEADAKLVPMRDALGRRTDAAPLSSGVMRISSSYVSPSRSGIGPWGIPTDGRRTRRPGRSDPASGRSARPRAGRPLRRTRGG